MAFSGIPAEAFDFYDALVADNSKSFFTAHKHEYEASVRGPMQDLAAALETRFGPGHLYRPYRDVRFSRDKTPYKDHQGLFVPSRNGLGWYAQVSVHGFMAAGGWYTSTPEQVQRYREAVDADEAGVLQRLLDDAEGNGLLVGGQMLKTRPRGVAADHPRLDLLRHRTLYLSRSWPPQPWLGTAQVLDVVSTTWEAMRPIMDWLAEAAGPGDPPMGSARRTSRA
jgi:uncharacterized protein (TIGR02453 family)